MLYKYIKPVYVFLYCIFLEAAVSTYVDIVIKKPVIYKEENISVICRPHPAHTDSVGRVRMIRIYVEHEGGRLGSVESKLSRIVQTNSTEGYDIQFGPAQTKTARYLITGDIRAVGDAYLEVTVKASDVMCSDSRLFRCEMDFVLKNKTQATGIKDGATCIKGPCNNCFNELQNFGTLPQRGAERMAATMKDPLFFVGSGLGLIGILSLVCGAILIAKSRKSRTEAGSRDTPLPIAGFAENPNHYAELDESGADRGNGHYLTTSQKRPDENLYSALN